jgi:hypothetical protein
MEEKINSTSGREHITVITDQSLEIERQIAASSTYLPADGDECHNRIVKGELDDIKRLTARYTPAKK